MPQQRKKYPTPPIIYRQRQLPWLPVPRHSSPFRIAYYTPNSTIKNTLLSYNKKISLTCGPAASAALFANVATALFMVEMFAVQCLLGDERRDNRKANAHEGLSDQIFSLL
eukprot:scaffold3724_cov123-Skeletonema_dohrnii-CCMP3373.AAC.9